MGAAEVVEGEGGGRGGKEGVDERRDGEQARIASDEGRGKRMCEARHGDLPGHR